MYNKYAEIFTALQLLLLPIIFTAMIAAYILIICIVFVYAVGGDLMKLFKIKKGSPKTP